MLIHHLIAAQAARTPETMAVSMDGQSLTYREVDRQANRLAHRLVASGVGPEVRVGICLQRSPQMVVAVLGVLKAGGAYVPLSPNDPAARLAFLLTDSKVALVLAEPATAPLVQDAGPPVLRLDGLEIAGTEGQDSAEEEAPPEVSIDPENLVYVLYTSGSTGQPKGAMIRHSSLMILVTVFEEEVYRRFGEVTKVSFNAPLFFDVSVQQWTQLAFGRSLFIVSDEVRMDAEAMVEHVRETGVEMVDATPTHLRTWLDAGLDIDDESAPNFVVGGEATDESLWSRLRAAKGSICFNGYGPTECTVTSTYAEIRQYGETPSIGKPLGFARSYLLDAALQPVASGEDAEICLGGDGLARGYLGRPGLTADRFVPNPSASSESEAGGRIYLTGDLGREMADESIEFRGRTDHQVKLRGYRIELGEIEAALLRHPSVGSAVVSLSRDGARLMAFVVPEALGEGVAKVVPAELQADLRKVLPKYMVPASFQVLESFPQSRAGKLDRRALLEMEDEPADLGQEYAAPRNPEEEALAAIVSELLSLERVGIHDDFFALGGYSLLVTQLVARVREQLKAELSLKDVHQAPTVAGLAGIVRRPEGRRVLPPIHRLKLDGPAPLSFPQERVWFLNELAPGNVAYNTQATIHFDGPLDPEIFQRVFTEIVRRHEVFRSSFPAVDGRPVQIPLEPMTIPLPLVDLQGLPEEEREPISEALVARAMEFPFDLLSPPLSRWYLIRPRPLHTVMIQVEHHFAHDGWSAGLLMREMKELYIAFASGQPSPLLEPPVQSSDFAVWQREWLQGEVLEEYLDYWTKELEDSPPSLELPTDHPRPRVQSFVGDLLRAEIPDEEAEDLRRFARNQGATLFTVMLAGFEVLLARMAGQGDLVVGTAAANRRLREVELMLGMVVNTLVLRARLAPSQPFSDLLAAVHENSLEAFAYQDIPLDKLVERLDPERDLSRNPLFQVMFSFHDSPQPDMDFAGLTGRLVERHNGSAKSDINIVGIPRAEQRIGLERLPGKTGITLLWEYCTALFEHLTMERMVGHYRTLLAAAVENPDCPLGELPLLSPVEREQLVAWNETAAELPPNTALHELFEKSVDRAPASLAIAASGRQLTYEDLEGRANQLARFLAGQGAGPETVVAVCLSRSPELVAAALGVLKTGAAYLPLDPSHPADRLAYTLEDSGVDLLLAGETLDSAVVPGGVKVIVIDSLWSAFQDQGTERLQDRPVIHPMQSAYVIYTSGSTGRPKGTVLSHGAAVNLVSWHLRAMEVKLDDRSTLVASPAFDASVWETWPYLAAGSSLHVPEEELRTDPEALYGWFAREEVTIAFLPTPLGEALLEIEAPAGLALRTLLVGGDRLHRAPRPSLPFRVVNNYGPTEDAVVSTSGEVVAGEKGAPSIGRPVDNTRVYILDGRLRQVPARIPGELCLAGAGLARGYLGRPSLTAQLFVPNPLQQQPSERLYRTGDRVRYRFDGEIEFLGRTDNQVKVRGFRIELGEIEAVLEEHPAVSSAVVLPARDGNRLMAFVVASAKDPESRRSLPGQLREQAVGLLPEFMVPAAFQLMESFPLSPTGKVDRDILSALEDDLDWGASQEDERTTPLSLTEELLMEIWRGVLGRREIGVRDEFFALGGHSLLATQVASRVREAFHVELSLQSFFQAATIEALARVVDSLAKAGKGAVAGPQPGSGGCEALMSFAQERMWFLDQLIADRAAYHIARAYRFQGPFHVQALEGAVAVVVERHGSLRTRFSDKGGSPVQIREESPAMAVSVIDLSSLGNEASVVAEDLRHREGRHPFDLRRLPLMRMRLLRLSDEDHQLLATQHHIVTDGLSTGIVLREIAAFYEEATGGSAANLPPLELEYTDVSRWQKEWIEGEVLENLVEYWREALKGAPSVLELPADRPRPMLQSFRGAEVTMTTPPGLAEGLERVSRESGVTWFMTLLAAFTTLLGRWAAQRDVVVGTPVAGRGREEVEGLVGLFANTLALRLRLAGSQTFAELLGQTREVTVGALAHQDLPFEKLVEQLAPQRDLSHSPVYQTLFVPEDPAMDRLVLPGLEVSTLPVRRDEAQFDLALFVKPESRGLKITLRYATALFDATTMMRLAGHLDTLLAEIAGGEGAEQRLDELPFLTAAERHAVISEWNDRGMERLEFLCLHEMVERQVKLRPEAVAVTTGEETFSYAEINRRANQLANLLRQMGACPGFLVGVHLDRRVEMLVAVLGILKSGAAYVPLESGWPGERIHWILDERGIDTLVTRREMLQTLTEERAPEGLRHVVCVDSVEEGVEAERFELRGLADLALMEAENPSSQATADDLAYIIFTSGSTGTPKGVMVQHRPVTNLIHWVEETFAVGPEDQLFYTTALSFDLSVYDIFGTLATGGSIRLASDEELQDPQRLVEILRTEPVTFWDSAPAALQRLAPFFPDEPVEASLRLVFLSGDWIPVGLPDRVRRVFPKTRVIGLGGATEATVWSNVFPIGEVDPNWTSIPYGRPIDNGRYHVLDERLTPCPIGVAGDLYIGGRVLSTGYAGEPQLTAQQYIPDPFNGISPLHEASGSRLYRTGDRVRFWNDGLMEFLGRQDTQVKVRGYRIELGEIETLLGDHPKVATAVVVVREDVPGDQRLVAYLTANEDQAETTFDELRQLARRRLPDYMVPTAFVALSTWPVTPTGKLDRKALPSPEEARRRVVAAPKVTPRTEAEKIIASVWQEVIGIQSVGTDENFFDLGGHSLLMARVHARLQESLPHEVTLADLFRYPTVASLAEAVAPEEAAIAAGEVYSKGVVGQVPAGEESRFVAIIGMAGRFASAGDLEEFWKALRDGEELIRTFTDDELRSAGVPEEDLENPRYVRARGMLPDRHHFDARFFDYSPREAEIIDPQQRLFLETAWSALEDAGYGVQEGGALVGIYAGVSPNGYLDGLMADRQLVQAVGGYQIAISNEADFLPTRVSYKLNLHGPSLTVQTACSTSLVATHLACKALVAGDCDLAVAGGASVRAEEERGYFFEEGGIASPDGHNRAFDAAASGTVGGSGVGAVVLKRLDRALEDGDPIYAVIRGFAINNDGSRKVGFTAPSVDGQVKALQAALEAAGAEPASIGYLEAHGTATPMGDLIEVTALNEVFGTEESRGTGRCALGSVKSNIGHLDAAAGVAGLIKAALCIHHRELVPSLHFESPNPQIDFSAGPFAVSSQSSPWEGDGRALRAGVSSFGIGGTNAHVVLEEAPSGAPAPAPRPVHLLLLSARTATALESARQRLARNLENRGARVGELSQADLADVAFTLQVGRRAMEHRCYVVCRDGAEAVASLRGERLGWTEERSDRPAKAPVTFLFPGQGAQYAAMAGELYVNEPLFRKIVDDCLDLMTPELGEDLRPWLLPSLKDEKAMAAVDEELGKTSRTQPALFVVELALARLLESWGVRPQALLGHSIGELVAATVSGVFELEDALRLVALRGRLMESCQPGSMLAVALDETTLRERLEALGDGLALAAVNGEEACVVSGPEERVAAFEEILRGEDIEVRGLHTSHAFHSEMMEPILQKFQKAVERTRRKAPSIPFISNLSGTWIGDDEAQDPAYWARQLRHTVLFSAGLEEVLASPGGVLLEVGPGRQLTTLAKRHPKGRDAGLIQACLPHAKDRGRDEDSLHAALGQLWLAGVEPRWQAVQGQGRRRVHLPTYPFEGVPYVAGLRTAIPGGVAESGLDKHSEEIVLQVQAAARAVPVPGGELTGVQLTIAEVWRDMLGVDRIRAHDDFFDLGGSSLMAIRLRARLEEDLRVELPASFLLENPILEDLAEKVEAIAGGDSSALEASPSCLVSLQKGGDRPPLYLVHQVGGQAYTFRALARALGSQVPVFGLRSLGLESGEEPLETVEAMAAHYLELLRETQPQGPYQLGGASMGGMVAFEMAHQLQRAGEEVSLLTVMDTPCLDQMPEEEDAAVSVAAIFAGHGGIELDLEELRRLSCQEERLAFAFAKAREKAPDTPLFSLAEARRLVTVLQSNVEALYAYQPEPYGGRVLLFRAAERRPGDPPRPELAWIRLALGGLDYFLAPGNHLSMHEPPHVETMADHLRQRLRARSAKPAPGNLVGALAGMYNRR